MLEIPLLKERNSSLNDCVPSFLGTKSLIFSWMARQAIEQKSSLYTWVTADKKEREVDGLTILALILTCICPNFKVDLYAEITNVKKITIAQYDYDCSQISQTPD